MRPGDTAGESHLIVTVHGIRTFGKWQERLEALVMKTGDSEQTKFVHYKYGYFSVLAFLFPPLRWLVVLRFRSELRQLLGRQRRSRVDLVGHSFGTHIIAWALWGLNSRDQIKIHTVILSGSVLHPGFRWSSLIGRRVGRVINDCGTRDGILVVNQLFVLFTGMAGRIGLTGMMSDFFRNRYSAFGHSGYFHDQSGHPDDRYMQMHWVPLITRDEPIPVFGEPPTTGVWNGFLIWFANNSEPIKLTVAAVVLIAPLIWINGLREEAVTQAEAARISSQKGSVVLSNLADDERDAGRTRTALLLAVEALPADSQETPELVVPEAISAMISALSHPVEVLQIAQDSEVLFARFSGDALTLTTGDKAFGIRVWDAETGKLRQTIAPSEYLDSDDLPVHYSHDAQWFLTARSNTRPAVHHAASGEAISFDAARGRQSGLAFSPDNSIFTVADLSDGVLRVGTTIGAKLIAERNAANCDFASAAIHSDNRAVAATCRDGSVRYWRDVNSEDQPVAFEHTWRGARTWDNSFNPPVTFDQSGQKIAFGLEDGTIVIWDVADPIMHPRRFDSFQGKSERPTHVGYNTTNTKLVIGYEDGALEIVEPAARWTSLSLGGHTKRINSAVFDAAGGMLLTASDDETVRIWDLRIDEAAREFEIDHGHIQHVEFNPDGQAVAALSFTNLLTLWDRDSGILETIKPALDASHFLIYSKDGSQLAGGDGLSSPRWFELSNKEKNQLIRGRLNLNLIDAAALSADDRFIAFGSAQFRGKVTTEIQLWEVGGNAPLLTIETADGVGVTALEFDPSTERIFVGFHDGQIRSWRLNLDAGSGADSATFERSFVGHSDRIHVLATDPTGSWLVSGSGDGSLRTWNTDTGWVRGFIPSPSEHIAAARFVGEAVEFATVVARRTVRIRQKQPAEALPSILKQMAESMNLQPLSYCERRSFGLPKNERAPTVC